VGLTNLGSESEKCVGSRVHLVGVSISFEKNFYRLLFAPPPLWFAVSVLQYAQHQLRPTCRCIGVEEGEMSYFPLSSTLPRKARDPDGPSGAGTEAAGACVADPGGAGLVAATARVGC
jgi:hypothetical protein